MKLSLSLAKAAVPLAPGEAAVRESNEEGDDSASVGVTSPLEPEKAVGRGDEGREDGEDGGGRHLPMDSRGKKAHFIEPSRLNPKDLLSSKIHRKMSSSTVLIFFVARRLGQRHSMDRMAPQWQGSLN
ncbi:unnamed protein product [Caenorhabditis auriculariae]|uniref:Uncharacterized protein n=1 Tax=Caenorhabditis auriculariae TaxID=2777116 RepID=A0A8S1HB86_9PELO|nr:unnamed protein product [Caenorhabditis auriculariae]